jgi:hypothetical protein
VDDFYYAVDVFAPPNGDAYPEPLSVVDIEAKIRAAVEDAKSRKDGGEQPPMVGILTGDERDTWTTVSYMNRWAIELICRTEKRSFTSRLRIATTSTPSQPPWSPSRSTHTPSQVSPMAIRSDPLLSMLRPEMPPAD